MKKLDTKTLATVAGGTLCAGVSVGVSVGCAPACPRPRPAAAPSPRSADRSRGSLNQQHDIDRRDIMKKLDTKTLATVAGGTICAGVSVGVSVGCAPACPPAPTCGSSKSKKC